MIDLITGCGLYNLFFEAYTRNVKIMTPATLKIQKEACVDLNIPQNLFVLDTHGANNISPSLSSLLRNLSNGVSLLGT
jgi:hypothetical protein